MVAQVFNQYIAKGYAGDLVDSSPRTTQTGIVEAATLDFGLAVERGTVATDERYVVVGHATGVVHGISMREYNHEAATRPSDGSVSYLQSESASIMLQGFLYVIATCACTAGQLMLVDDVTGEFHGAADTGRTASKNVTAWQTVGAAGIVKVRIDIYLA